MDDFTGKNILITGSTSGIGKDLAFYLLQETNANVYVVGRNETKLNNCFGKCGERCHMLFCDLFDLSSIQEMFINLNGNKLDGLVHCAGLSPLMKVVDNEIATMVNTFTVNFFSFVELCKHFHNPQYSNDGSSIVAMSSIAASTTPFRQTIYSSSKAALEQSIRCIAKEFLDRKIRVNGIAAGAVETEMLKKLEAQDDGLKDRLVSYYPLGCIPTTDIIFLIHHLLSYSSKHIDGSILKIDSAFSIR